MPDTPSPPPSFPVGDGPPPAPRPGAPPPPTTPASPPDRVKPAAIAAGVASLALAGGVVAVKLTSNSGSGPGQAAGPPNPATATTDTDTGGAGTTPSSARGTGTGTAVSSTAASSTSATAAALAGDWTGNIDGGGDPVDARITLDQGEPSAVTGKLQFADPDTKEWADAGDLTGTMEGSTLTLESNSQAKLTLTVTGEKLTGDGTLNSTDHPFPIKVTLARE